MREIKFRGISEEGNKWVFGDLFHGVTYISINVTERFDNYNSIKHVVVNPETVGQYTGLNDKNGNEIYEGDILEFSMHARECGSVIFRDGSFMVFRNSDDCCIADFEDENGYFFEILGNIYENTELIERKENV